VVGRDVLFGSVWGVLSAVGAGLVLRLPRLLGYADSTPDIGFLDTLLGFRSRLSFVVARPLDAALLGLGMLLLFLVLRLILRRDGLAGFALIVILCLVGIAQSDQPLWFSLPVGLVFVGSLVWLLLRFGLVATIAGVCVSDALRFTPQSLELDSWLGSGTTFTVPLVIVLAVYAFRTATRRLSPGRPPTSADAISAGSA
jgi:hypothetical protein